MKCAILTIGTEILFGDILNTNSKFISRELINIGIDVYYHYTVGDNGDRLKDLIEDIFEDCDLIVTTGGLGPTEDDLTKETICEIFNDELIVDENAYNKMMNRAKLRGTKPTPNNLKMVKVPSKAYVLNNNNGAAPGFVLTRSDGKMLAALPGPPVEMELMFRNELSPYLEKITGNRVYFKMLKTFGIGESALETILMKHVHGQTNPTLATYAKQGQCALRIASKGDDKRTGKQVVEDKIEEIKPLIRDYVYSYDNEEMNEVLVRLLKEKKLTVASAESMTGGLFAASVTSVSGASEIIKYSAVTYSDEAKADILGINPEIISKYGVYSKEVAEAMAVGVRRLGGADIGVSITGVAGPKGEDSIEAGTMYVGISFDENTYSVEIKTGSNDREWNRTYGCLSMMDAVRKTLI